MHLPRLRPRYADVAATLALVFAMSGTAYAVATIGTSDIKDGAVTTAKLHFEAVTSSKIDPGAVSNAKIAASAVTTGKLAPGAVTTGKLDDGSVSTGKLATGAVTHSKLGANSVTGGNVVNRSLTLADLRGSNTSGSISIHLNAGVCSVLNFGVSGAQAGQLVLMSYTGNAAIPNGVVISPFKVISSTTIRASVCNVSGSNIDVTGVGVRVVTLG
jgi:hypothetical protein